MCDSGQKQRSLFQAEKTCSIDPPDVGAENGANIRPLRDE